MKQVFVALCLAIVTCSAKSEYRIIGAGATSCGKYNVEKSDRVISLVYDSWIFGFLTGLSARDNFNLLGGYDKDAIVGAVDKYCRENPLELVETACRDVALQIIKAKR